MIVNNDYYRFINDCSSRNTAEKKKSGRFSIKNTLKFETSVRSAKSFRTLGASKMTKNIFKNISFARFQINFWKYLPKINPLGQFRIIWDIFVGMSTLFLFFNISISLSFAKSILLDHLLFFIIIYIVGIFIDLNTGFYEQGILIRNRRAAALNYLRKYFVFDLISTLSLIEQYFSQDLQYIICLFFLKGQYFTKISKIFKEVLHIKPIYHSIVSFIKLICVIIFAAHFFACIYISMVTFFNFSNNWIQKQGLDIDAVFRVYLRAFYYSCVTMLTVGYGDVTPQNDLEYSVVILTILIGCMFFGYSLNKIGTIFNEMEEQDKKILKNLFIINQYMSRKDIQKDLQFQVREYLTYYWSQNNSTENKAQEHIISQLSEGLKQKLQIQATRKVLNQCPIFRQNFTDEFLQKASTLIKEYRCYPDEIITFQGDVDDCSIFFVEQGNAVMCFQGNSNYLGKNDTSIDIKELKKGDTFGFYSFFTGQPRKLTIRSAGFTSLLLIERNPFIKLIKQYQQDYEIFCTICDNLLTGFKYQQVHSDCYCCQYNDHMITDCPKIHLVIDKIELSQRDMKQVRDSKHERRSIRQHPILDESEANLFIQSKLFYLQAYHQLFIGAFDNWFDNDDEDDEEDDELDSPQYNESDRISILQDKQKKNDSLMNPVDEDVFKQQKKTHSITFQRTQEKRISLIPPEQGKQAIESLVYIPDSKQTKDQNELNVNHINLQMQNNNKQGNFTNSHQNKKAKTSSLTRIRNPSILADDQLHQQINQNFNQYQQQNSTHSNYGYQQQTSNMHETSTKQLASFFIDQHPSLQINVINNEQDLTTAAFLSPLKQAKNKSIGESSMSDIERVQQMINQQGQQMQQQQSPIQPLQNLTSSTLANSQQPFQNQLIAASQQLTIQQFLQKQQQYFTQQCQSQQQFIQQQIQQIFSILSSNSSHNQNPFNIQGGWSPVALTPQQQLRRRSSAVILNQQNYQSPQQNQFNLNNYVFPPAQQLEQSNYGKSNNSLSNLTANDLYRQQSQNSRSKCYNQQQTAYMQQGDKMMLLQKLNNNNSQFNFDMYQEEDCKMKIFNHYFTDWNFNVILQRINLDNGFSVNSSEILQTTDHLDLMKKSIKQKGKGTLQEQAISNKRVTSIVYQNANEKKVQDVLSHLNQLGTRGIDESHANDPNQLNLPAIPTYIRDSGKGNTVIIPSIQEQNQQLAALKFTHQSINDKFIVFRKNNPQSNDPNKKQQNFYTSEFITDHTEKLKSMKRKSISVDVDIMKKLKPQSNFKLPNLSQNKTETLNILSQNKLGFLSAEFTVQNLDQSENIYEINEDSNIPISINSSGKQGFNNSWSKYIYQKQ